MQAFRAWRIHAEDTRIVAREDVVTLAELDAGEAVIRVRSSSINSRDALAGLPAALPGDREGTRIGRALVRVD